jgi:Uncharacterized protein conserved in bacteria
MIELGKHQELSIIRMKEVGAFVGDENGDEKDAILLPKKQVPSNLVVGDKINVFVYRDSSDRLIATTTVPKIELGELAVLTVKEVGNIGAFLDWGLEKDLLLPFKEQTVRVITYEPYLVALYIDKSDRLCATMDVYSYLRNDAPYKKDARVMGTIYDIKPEFGAFVAVDNCYNGLIPMREFFGDYKIGSRIEARVAGVREDGKLNLSIKEKAFLQMDMDSTDILNIIEESENKELPFDDKVSPEIIKNEFKMSKNAFKRAIGRLLKAEKIIIADGKIKLKV